MNFRYALIVAGMLVFLIPALHGQTGSFSAPAAPGGAEAALAASAARIAELERRIMALEQSRFTPVSGLPAGAMSPGEAPVPAPSVPRPSSVETPAAHQAWTGTHAVREGETLSSIARAYGTTSAELVRMNTIRDPNHIRSGQVLAVPGTQAARPQSSPAPAAKPPYVTTAAPPASAPAQSTITAKVQPEEAYFYYDVVEGDTMASVASMFFTTVAEVGNLNGINANSVLRAGQQLVVPTRLYFEEKKRREAKGIASASTKTAG